jgi:predicted lipid carrier protein YhbT
MATPTAAFFEELARRGYEPSLRCVRGTIRFDITGEGNWWVQHVGNGALTVARDGACADCSYTIAATDFVPLARGEHDPFTAALQGRLQIWGDQALALVTQRIFR